MIVTDTLFDFPSSLKYKVRACLPEIFDEMLHFTNIGNPIMAKFSITCSQWDNLVDDLTAGVLVHTRKLFKVPKKRKKTT